MLDTAFNAVAGGALGLLGGERANKANREEARRAREFNLMMSNTAYQRGMEDMEKAGLNPMLASKVGGASTPTAPLPAPAQNTAAAAVSALNTATQAELNSQNARKAEHEADRSELFNKFLQGIDAPKQVEKLTEWLMSKTAENESSAKGVMDIMNQPGYFKDVLDYYKNQVTPPTFKGSNPSFKQQNKAIGNAIKDAFTPPKSNNAKLIQKLAKDAAKKLKTSNKKAYSTKSYKYGTK